MKIVALMSGGLDSTLMGVLAKEEGHVLHPLFIDYGQRAVGRELAACRAAVRHFDLGELEEMSISGFGKSVPSGLTDPDLDVFVDAFLPGRNLLFLLCGAAHAYSKDADSVAIGLLSEETAIFPDQTAEFVSKAQTMLEHVLERALPIVAPLMSMNKSDVVASARERGITKTWSCHLDGDNPCGRCIACREFDGMEV